MARKQISEATLTTPAITDLVPIARPSDTTARQMTVGAIAGVAQEGNYMTAAVAATATTITPNAVPKGSAADSIWVVIDPYTDECEVRKVTAISGTTLTVAALDYAHAANDGVFITSEPVINVKWMGAKGDGSADDATAINRAIVQAYNLGDTTNITDFGSVFIPSGTHLVGSSIILYAFVRLFGLHTSASKIKLANNADTDVIITKDFATHTGEDIRHWSNGSPCVFAIENLTIDGNKDNNTSGAGIKIYGHHYRIDNVRIYETREQGLYSEYGSGGGGQASWYDIPQSYIGQLFIWKPDGYGIEFWGPHDSYFEHITINGAEAGGMYIDSDANTNGIHDMMFCHIYACGSASTPETIGFHAKTRVRASYIQVESSSGSNFVVEAAERWTVAKLVAYGAGHNVTNPNGRSPSHANFYDDSGSSYTALTNAIDGNTGTNSAVTVESAGPDYIYVGDDATFNEVIMDFASVVNANASVLTVEYWDGDSWEKLTTREGTDDAGATFGQDGRITFDKPSDWATNSVNSVTKYWLRLSVSANLTASVEIAEIEIRDERWNVHIKSSADYGQIGELYIKDEASPSDEGVGGIRIDADHVSIATALIDGESTAGTGVIVDGNACAFRGTIYDYSATGGKCLVTGESQSIERCHIDVRIKEGKIGWLHKRQSNHSIYDIGFYESAGNDAFDGKRPGDGDVWNVSGFEGDAANKHLYSERWGKEESAVDLTSTALQTITWMHDAIIQPNVEDCYCSLIKNTAVNDFVVDLIRVNTVTATKINVQVKLGTASVTGGAVADLRVGYRV